MKKKRLILEIMLLVTALTGVAEAVSDLKVAAMPSYTQSRTYANAALNEPITVWGRCWDGTAPYTYTLDFGDGTPASSGAVGNPNEISVSHTYTTSGSKTVTLTVQDSTGTQVARQAVIRVINGPTHAERVNMAIEKGLLYLYQVQRPDGSWEPESVYGREYQFGTTGLATLSFEENGHLPDDDPEENIYAERVQKALDWIISQGGTYAISAQPNGNPDSNGNGIGRYLWAGGHETYANSCAVMALVISQRDADAAKAKMVIAGPHAGNSYFDVVSDILDQFAFSNGDGAYRGGWGYNIRTSGDPRYDGSSQQWPALAIRAASDVWDIHPPQWLVDNMVFGMQLCQASNGAISYYNISSNTYWLNAAKTGGRW